MFKRKELPSPSDLLEEVFVSATTKASRHKQRLCLREAVARIRQLKFNPRKHSELAAFKIKAVIILEDALADVETLRKLEIVLKAYH